MHALARIELPDRYNLVDHFVDRHLREGRAEKTAIICGERRLTYADVAAQVNRLGNALLTLGVEAEQRVLLVLPDIPEFAAAYFGAMKIGAVVVPTSTALRAMDYSWFLEESQARVAIVDSTLFGEFAPALSGAYNCKHVIVCGEPRHGHLHWESVVKRASPTLESAPTSKDDAAFWLWTSGSTGRPKAAVHLHHDWVCSCEYYGRGVLDIGADDVTFSSSKLFHAYGLGNALMFPFHVGATTVLLSHKPQAKTILETAETYRPTLFFSVPTLYTAMLQKAQDTAHDLSSIRLAVSAAEPSPPKFFVAGRNVSESRFWTASDRPRRCIFISRRARETFVPEAPAAWCPAMNLPSSTTRGTCTSGIDRRPARCGTEHRAVLLEPAGVER